MCCARETIAIFRLHVGDGQKVPGRRICAPDLIFRYADLAPDFTRGAGEQLVAERLQPLFPVLDGAFDFVDEGTELGCGLLEVDDAHIEHVADGDHTDGAAVLLNGDVPDVA